MGEGIHYVITKGPCAPSCECTAIDGSPLAHTILQLYPSFDGLVVRILGTLPMVRKQVVGNTRSLVRLCPLAVSETMQWILEVFCAHVKHSVEVFALHLLQAA